MKYACRFVPACTATLTVVHVAVLVAYLRFGCLEHACTLPPLFLGVFDGGIVIQYETVMLVLLAAEIVGWIATPIVLRAAGRHPMAGVWRKLVAVTVVVVVLWQIPMTLLMSFGIAVRWHMLTPASPDGCMVITSTDDSGMRSSGGTFWIHDPGSWVLRNTGNGWYYDENVDYDIIEDADWSLQWSGDTAVFDATDANDASNVTDATDAGGLNRLSVYTSHPMTCR